MRPLLSLVALGLACPALAADIEASSHIESVTLYPDAAQATRIVEVELPVGASRVVLRNLSPSIDASTLRITGEGEAALILGSVDVRKAVAPRIDEAAEAQLKNLHGARDAAQVKVEALEGKLAMIQAYGRRVPEKADDKAAKPQDWDAGFEVIGAALVKTGEALRLARVEVAEIDARIKGVEAARPAPGPRGAVQDVGLDVEAPTAGKYRLRVSYRLAGARWTPAYDARLETGDQGKSAKLELLRRAAISQRTGEDWSDVSLSLAAFPAAAASSAPELPPQRIDFFEAPRPMAANMAKSLEAGAPAAPAQVGADAALRRATQQLAQVDFNGVQAFFRAPGKVSLASDGTTRLVALSAQSPKVELGWKSAPALDPRAFLAVHFSNGEEAPLLPGPVTLYRDGAMIGQSALKLTASQEGADLGFGPDERVTVTRAPVKRKENEPGWFGQTKTEVREFRTVLRNLHDFPVKVLLTDQTPFSENSAITVELLGQTTPPSDKDPDGKRGLLDWRVDLAPKETKEIRLAYRLKWPADREVFVP